MSALTTLHSSNQVDLKLRNKRFSNRGSLREGLFQSPNKSLRRSRTTTGITNTISSMLSDKTLSENNIGNYPNLRTKTHQNAQKILLQNENLDVKSTLSDFKFANKSVINNLPGLYPRVSIEGKHITNLVKSSIKNDILHEQDINSEIEEHSDPSVITLTSNNYHGLSTIKNNYNYSEDEISYNKVLEEKEKRKYTDVEIKVSTVKLLDNSEPLDLTKVKRRLVPDVSPLFYTHEFEPDRASDTDVLLKILSYEFEVIDKEDEEFERRAIEETDDLIVLWYTNALHSVVSICINFIHSFKSMTKEEYNSKYPWDKFYEPELYYQHDIDEDGVLNMDMIPEGLQGISNKIDETINSRYLYVLRKRG